ncbi:glycosyltransferase [Chlorobaculum sp. 24CR]|uniref:glycosyltransferase n=1 Tax=Chlorobaculum sp. 24CR TaxID=2508878 RepID=UPI00100C21A2|nr:glycosyltransferase [Chlorobaculum sp. 24CR]RXK88055.1 glycosyltransferase [Chlorobaculum sp. 24CR]
MHILQVNSDYEYGSTGRIASELQDRIVLGGDKCTVAYGRKRIKDVKNSYVIQIGSTFDNYLHLVQTRIFDVHGFSSLWATKAFIKKIDFLKPDLIHLHNLHGYYIHIGSLFEYLKKIKKPVIWTLHDCWPFTGHCAYYDYIGCDKWKKVCHHCALKGEYPSSYYIDRSSENYQQKKKIFNGMYNLTFVTPSRWLMRQVEDSYLNEYPVKVINNGIDIDVFKPVLSDIKRSYNLEGKFLILGVASVWGERKGLQYFIDLAERLKPDERIILVGVSERQIKQLPDGIIGVRSTNSTSQLAEIYSSADVFVNPTLEDNYPTTNLEAMACGTPVITFNSGGSAESIKEGCGIVVERGDLEKLVQAISVIKKNRKNFYDANCRQHALLSFNKNERFEEYIELYRYCVDG